MPLDNIGQELLSFRRRDFCSVVWQNLKTAFFNLTMPE